MRLGTVWLCVAVKSWIDFFVMPFRLGGVIPPRFLFDHHAPLTVMALPWPKLIVGTIFVELLIPFPYPIAARGG